MTKIEVGKYYRFTYRSPAYVKVIYAKVIGQGKNTFKIKGFSIEYDDKPFYYEEGEINIVNPDRIVKEITEEECERAIMLEML